MHTLDQMTPELFRELWKPNRPLAGDTKGVAYRMSPEEALEKQFIQTNGARNYKNLMVLDYDMEDADMLVKWQAHDEGIIPDYNYLTVNPYKGTAQVGFFLASPVGTPKGINWFDNVFTQLKEDSGSDEAYVGSKMRNPTHSGQATEWGTAKLYTLAEIAAFTKPKPANWYQKKNPLPEIGRHNILFNKLSSWSYREWRKPNFDTRIMLEAQRINEEFDPPLPHSHLASQARSIQAFISRNFSEAQFRAIQSARSKKRWGNTVEEMNAKILNYLEVGFSAKEISEQEGKSMGQTYNLIRRAKKSLEIPPEAL